MHMPLHFPFLGKEHLHCVFVLCRQDQHRLRWIDAKIGKRGVEQRANLLELVRNAPRFLFSGIARNHKVRAAYLEPPLVRIASPQSTGAGKQRYESGKTQNIP